MGGSNPPGWRFRFFFTLWLLASFVTCTSGVRKSGSPEMSWKGWSIYNVQSSTSCCLPHARAGAPTGKRNTRIVLALIDGEIWLSHWRGFQTMEPHCEKKKKKTEMKKKGRGCLLGHDLVCSFATQAPSVALLQTELALFSFSSAKMGTSEMGVADHSKKKPHVFQERFVKLDFLHNLQNYSRFLVWI